eukprot:TRINITY_DN9487_c0_g1_i1.p1 TRINITY_DN9487_c0_g1~~TRINITY_DN9487_c0_g1_i1.p1  ORF type:complete len:387 (+),score=75.61 TRINITY_DN9487_c0_g1_i1:229-1389(+)
MQTPQNSLQIRADSFRADDLYIEHNERPKKKPSIEETSFSKFFTDHMLIIEHSEELGGWLSPKIQPYAPITILPCSHVLHYATAAFEGMKAYYCNKDGSVRLFRPEMNMARFKSSLDRLCLPSFSTEQLLECIKKLVDLDREWVPQAEGYSVYLRPFAYDDSPTLGLSPPSLSKIVVIMSPSAPYFSEGIKPVKVFLDEKNVRAWPGGVGSYKLASNYAPTILPQTESAKSGRGSMCLFCLPRGDSAEDAILSEFAGANVMVLFTRQDGARPELATPPLDGTILPGITRSSVIELCKQWDEVDVVERNITVGELKTASENGNFCEMFLCGTAVTVVPVLEVCRENGEVLKPVRGDNPEGTLAQRILQTIVRIQYGEIEHPWSVVVE